MSAPTLYWAKGACSFGPAVVAEEAGLKLELRQIDPSKGDNQTDAYKALHPRSHVPVFVDGDFVLTEAHAIMVHLADTNPAAKLMPAPGTKERARVHELCNILASAVHVGFRQVRRPSRFTDEEAAGPGIKKHGLAYLARLYSELDARIAGKSWAVGDQFTVADPYLMIMTRWGHTAEVAMAPFPALAAHTQKMLTRPAVQRVVEREGLNPWP